MTISFLLFIYLYYIIYLYFIFITAMNCILPPLCDVTIFKITPSSKTTTNFVFELWKPALCATFCRCTF